MKKTMNERLADLAQEYEKLERLAVQCIAQGDERKHRDTVVEMHGIRTALVTLGYDLTVHFLTFEDYRDGNAAVIITKA